MPDIKYSLRKGTSKAQFEADKIARLVRARSAVDKLKRQIENQVVALGQKALQLADEGEPLNGPLQEIYERIGQLRVHVQDGETAIEAIHAEAWVPPPPPPPKPRKAPTTSPLRPEDAPNIPSEAGTLANLGPLDDGLLVLSNGRTEPGAESHTGEASSAKDKRNVRRVGEKARGERDDHGSDPAAARLRAFIQMEQTINKCPICHTVSPPSAVVCIRCGYRLDG